MKELNRQHRIKDKTFREDGFKVFCIEFKPLDKDLCDYITIYYDDKDEETHQLIMNVFKDFGLVNRSHYNPRFHNGISPYTWTDVEHRHFAPIEDIEAPVKASQYLQAVKELNARNNKIFKPEFLKQINKTFGDIING